MMRVQFDNPYTCFGCPFLEFSDVCGVSHRLIKDENIVYNRPEFCLFVPDPEAEGWYTLDYERIPDETVINLGEIEVENMIVIHKDEEE